MKKSLVFAAMLDIQAVIDPGGDPALAGEEGVADAGDLVEQL